MSPSFSPTPAHINFSSYGWAKFCQHAHAMASLYDGDAGSRGPKLYFYCLAIELGLKASILSKNPTEITINELKKISHNLLKLLDRFEKDWGFPALSARERNHVECVNRQFMDKSIEYFSGNMLESMANGWRGIPDPEQLERVAATINAFLASHDYFIAG